MSQTIRHTDRWTHWPRVRCRSLLLCFGTLCYVPSIYICVRCKTLCITGGQHDGLCPFWQPARSIFTVLLCCVFFRANKLSLSLSLKLCSCIISSQSYWILRQCPLTVINRQKWLEILTKSNSTLVQCESSNHTNKILIYLTHHKYALKKSGIPVTYQTSVYTNQSTFLIMQCFLTFS